MAGEEVERGEGVVALQFRLGLAIPAGLHQACSLLVTGDNESSLSLAAPEEPKLILSARLGGAYSRGQVGTSHQYHSVTTSQFFTLSPLNFNIHSAHHCATLTIDNADSNQSCTYRLSFCLTIFFIFFHSLTLFRSTVMDRCPPEVVHAIFALLEFQDVSTLRRTSKKYATIGLEYLTDTVSFFFTEESIARAEALANHPIVRNRITSLQVEGYVIADVGCQHNYAAHYDQINHHDHKPQSPGPDCSPREQRLFDRNLAKFQQKIDQDYQQYRVAREHQQTLIKSATYYSIGRTIAQELPNLERLYLQSTPRCMHHLSKRVREVFFEPRLLPMDVSTEHAVAQLQHLIVPGGNALLGLKKLDVQCISPCFLSREVSQTAMNQVFRTLQNVNLMFRLTPDESLDFENDYEGCYDSILGTSLRDALASAQSLECLALSVHDHYLDGTPWNVTSILGDSTWPKLKLLDIGEFWTEEEYFASALQRHSSSLDVLKLGCVKLRTGNWRSLTESIRKIKVKEYIASGVFEDPQDTYVLDFHSVDAWRDDLLRLSMVRMNT